MGNYNFIATHSHLGAYATPANNSHHQYYVIAALVMPRPQA